MVGRFEIDVFTVLDNHCDGVSLLEMPCLHLGGILVDDKFSLA